MSLIWKDPPAPSIGHAKPSAEHLNTAHQLRARSGEWAVVKSCLTAEQAAGLAGRIRKGEIVAFAPAGEFEAITRQSPGGREVYVRHVGAVAKPAPVKAAPKVAARRISKAG